MLDPRDTILAALTASPVPFEAGGLPLCLRPWTAADRQEFFRWNKSAQGVGLYERLFVLSVCDPAGVRLFNASDAGAVGLLDGAAVEAVARRVIELNGLGDDGGKAPSPTTPS